MIHAFSNCWDILINAREMYARKELYTSKHIGNLITTYNDVTTVASPLFLVTLFCSLNNLLKPFLV